VRYRRFTFRYTEVSGGFPRAFEAEVWSAPSARAMASPFFRPAADVIETATAYLVVLELPGVDDDEVNIVLHPDALVVSGTRRNPGVEAGEYHAAEIRFGPFRFDMSLPADADAEDVDAHSEKGLVRIRIAKRARRVT
jgi:HSP20 family protein